MSDITPIGTNLSHADSLVNLEGFQVITKLGRDVSSSLYADPSQSHPAISLILPTCNEAVTKAGASSMFNGYLLLCMAYNESRYKPRVNVASKPHLIARGLVQFLYDTGRAMKPPIEDFYNPTESIYSAAQYMRDCYNQMKKKAPTVPPSRVLGYALMAYNAGPGHTLGWYDYERGVNIVDGKKTRVSPLKYAKHINEYYRLFTGSPGPATFLR